MGGMPGWAGGCQRVCPPSEESAGLHHSGGNRCRVEVTGQGHTGAGEALRPDLPEQRPWRHGEEGPLPVSSPSAVILQRHSLGWLRTPVPTPKGVAETFTAGERARREEGLERGQPRG